MKPSRRLPLPPLPRLPASLPAVLLAVALLRAAPLLQAQRAGDGHRLPPPLLAGVVELRTLAPLWAGGGERAADLEPLDIACTSEGPVLLFADRLLSLGTHLEMSTRTVEDLVTLPALPEGFVPSRLLLDGLREPVLYEAAGGELLFLTRHGAGPLRCETDFAQALEAAGLPGGGVVLSDGRRLVLFHRRGNDLSRREIPLPALTVCLSSDEEGRLWAYDLAARRVRVLDADGGELFSISPDISGATLLFPQILQTGPEGRFFLGGAGELWCFEADGSVRWRLAQFTAGHRQALPAFYRLAVGGEGPAEPGSFYILDPLGRRLLKFVEKVAEGESAAVPDGQSAAEPASASIDAMLAAAFQPEGEAQSRQNEIVRFCLERELLLQAAFFRRSGTDEPVVTNLKERMNIKQAGLAAELAGRLEQELRLPEAEEACNRALSLYRELRSLDPVDPRYPEAIRRLGERRNALRRTLVAESFLRAEIAPRAGAPADAPAPAARFELVLVNTSATPAEQVEVSLCFGGYPDSRWQGSVESIAPGDGTVLAVPFSAGEAPAGAAHAAGSEDHLNTEQLRLSCNLLVRFVHDRQRAAQFLRLPAVFPAGTLRLPGRG